MKRRVGFLTFSFLFISILGSAQETCPEGFRYAGALSGTGSSMETFDKTIIVKLPEGATLDESYQQTNVRATNGKRKAQSNLRPLDIPKGIHITPNGSSDGGKVWAVSEPKLMGNGTSTRYAFGMHLFCSVPASPYSQIGGGVLCNGKGLLSAKAKKLRAAQRDYCCSPTQHPSAQSLTRQQCA